MIDLLESPKQAHSLSAFNRDHHSFEEFADLDVMNDSPDATTLAFFRERLRKAGVIEELFEMFESNLRAQDLEARGGQIIDATLVPVP